MRFEIRGSRHQGNLSGKVCETQPKNLIVGLLAFLFGAAAAFAAPKSASAYYGDAAFQYIENRLPTAEITCNEGLQYYPNDQKLQMLLDRIREAKDEQKNENKKNDPKNDQNQDQNNDQNQDQNQDQQNQNGDQGNSSSGESSSSQSDDQNGQNGGQSSSSGGESSSSDGGAGEQPQQPEEGSSDSQGDQPEEQDVPLGQMSPEEANQLLKDFDEQNGERKPWKPIRGQARPAKDW